jgi:prepilin-type N-terminal cleavage/methylation domain-containing protein
MTVPVSPTRCKVSHVPHCGRRRMPRGLRKRPGDGFSLLEMVFVLAVASVVAAILVPRYASASARYRVNFAARRVAADLELAAATARNASGSRTVTFREDATYTINLTRDLDRGGDTYRVRLAAEPYGVTRIKAAFGPDATVIFDGYGTPDTDGVVVVEVGSEQRTVSLDPTGKASVE